MSLGKKIQYSFAKIKFSLWPLPEKEPSTKPTNIVASKIVLLYNFSTEKEQETLAGQLLNIKKQLHASSSITICNFSDTQLLNENEDVVNYSPDDFHLLGKPKSKLSTWISKNTFDILISFVGDENVYCNNLVSCIKSDFKAGIYRPNVVKLFDLTIKQETNNINNQLELFIQYINKLNINK